MHWIQHRVHVGPGRSGFFFTYVVFGLIDCKQRHVASDLTYGGMYLNLVPDIPVLGSYLNLQGPDLP